MESQNRRDVLVYTCASVNKLSISRATLAFSSALKRKNGVSGFLGALGSLTLGAGVLRNMATANRERMARKKKKKR